MVTQTHIGSGDNVLNKYDSIIHSIQARELDNVIDNIMHDIDHRELDRASEKLNVLKNINALETDVQLLLQALTIKVELVNNGEIPQKNNLLRLLQYPNLPINVQEVVCSILIDIESHIDRKLARERYLNSNVNNIYINEVFLEHLASKKELKEFFCNAKTFNLSEQEFIGLIRGSVRVADYEFSLELANHLDKNYSSSYSNILLLYTESYFILTQNQKKHYVSLSLKTKIRIDNIIDQLLIIYEKNDDKRYISILSNLLLLTRFSDNRLIDLGIQKVDSIRIINPSCATFIEQFFTGLKSEDTKFELVSDSLDLEQFSLLDSALTHDQIKIKTVSEWFENGGEVNTGNEYLNAFLNLYLRASICSSSNKHEVQKINIQAKEFLTKDTEKFYSLNPNTILRLSEKFLELNLPFNAVNYLKPFLDEEAWVSAIFECYLSALVVSEQYELFFNKIKHLQSEHKTILIYLRESQVYQHSGNYKSAINSAQAAIAIEPTNIYAWLLRLQASRKEGLSSDERKSIIFEMPEQIFEDYDDSKIKLLEEIAIYIDKNIAERILVDWFVQYPNQVAKPLTDIITNINFKIKQTNNNPYIPQNCGDGITYTDGFETKTKILVKNVDVNHSSLLNVDSPLGKTLENAQEGDTIDEITVIKRIPPYVAAFRLAAEIRSNSNDGTDAFRQYSLPSNKDDLIPYFEKIMRRYSSKEKNWNDVLQNPNIPLLMRGHLTDPGNSIRGAISHLTSPKSTQYMGLFNRGEETPNKVVIDIYTAVYLALMGFTSILPKLPLEIIISQQMKNTIEAWIDDICRDNYLSMGVSDIGLYRITADDIKRDPLGVIQGLQSILEYAKVEPLKLGNTPEILVQMKDIVGDVVYSTFQISFANNIPLLCVDHLICEIVSRSSCPIANMNVLILKLLSSLSMQERKKSIEFNLFAGTPVSILYNDVIELSRSSKVSDSFLVYKFLKKYGDKIDECGDSIGFLTNIVRKTIAVACIEGTIFNKGKRYVARYDGYFEYIFNYCCRSALQTIVGGTSEQKFANLLYNIINIPAPAHNFVKFITILALNFARGHFLDSAAVINALTHIQKKAMEQRKD